MRTYFARHSPGVDGTTRQILWERPFVAIHYPQDEEGNLGASDNRSLSPGHYAATTAPLDGGSWHQGQATAAIMDWPDWRERSARAAHSVAHRLSFAFLTNLSPGSVRTLCHRSTSAS